MMYYSILTLVSLLGCHSFVIPSAPLKTKVSLNMDPAVVAACDLAIVSAFGKSSDGTVPEYKPIGSAADTAFSGSAIIELEVENKDRVVLKHSSVRTMSVDDLNSQKYAAALKVDKSSRNECVFLQTYSDKLCQTKVRIPKTYFARNHPADGVTLLLESLSTLDGLETTRVNEIPLGPKLDCTLEWLANFHAKFLPFNPNTFNNFPLESPSEFSSMWSMGTHISLEKRSPAELRDLPSDLSEFVDRFRNSHDYFKSKQAKIQGARVHAVATDVSNSLHPDNNPAHRTMVHGDYKQGNMFFATTAKNESKIAVFDWQWTGPGIGATDLAYLCVMAASDVALDDYETNILRPYHSHLLKASGSEDDKNYSYNDLLNEFKIAMIDIQRWLGGTRLKVMTPETVEKANQNIDVNHGIFRRSIKRLVWIFQFVDNALDDIEFGRLKLLHQEESLQTTTQ